MSKRRWMPWDEECPGCGSSDVEVFTDAPKKEAGDEELVHCRGCDKTGRTVLHEDDEPPAITVDWHYRSMDSQAKRIEELEDALEDCDRRVSHKYGAEELEEAIRGRTGPLIENIVQQGERIKELKAENERLRLQRDMSDELAATLQAGREKDEKEIAMLKSNLDLCMRVDGDQEGELADLRERLREVYGFVAEDVPLPDSLWRKAVDWLTENKT